jgi:DNA-binding response OmpR family regulator
MEPMVRILKNGLARYAHTVLTALSGEEALEIVKTSQVDLIISDLGLPGINGWQVGQAVMDLSAGAGAARPGFILMTGWTDEANNVEAIRKSGVDAVVEKPVDMRLLLSVIHQVRSKSASRS